MSKLQESNVDVSKSQDILQIHYIPVSKLAYWDKNPKLHDIGLIINSIKEYGFRDPPAWDNTLQALVEGNGRTEALISMMRDGDDLPKGIAVDSESGEWCAPVIFGLDSNSIIHAEKYAVDHNNLTMTGGDFSLFDISRMWDNEQYKDLLQGFVDENNLPVSFDISDAQLLLSNYDVGFEPLSDTSQNDSDYGEDRSIEFPAIQIVVENYNLVPDVKDAIAAILSDHPEWDAYIRKED